MSKDFLCKSTLKHSLRVTLYKKRFTSNGNLLRSLHNKTLREMEFGNSQSGVCKATVNYYLEGKSTGFIGTEMPLLSRR